MGSSWIRPLSSALFSAGQAFRVAKFSVMVCVLGIFVHLCRAQTLTNCTSDGSGPTDLKGKFNLATVIAVYGTFKEITDDGVTVTNECIMKGAGELPKDKTFKKSNFAATGTGWCYPGDSGLEAESKYVFFLKQVGAEKKLVDYEKIDNVDVLKGKCSSDSSKALKSCKKPGDGCAATITGKEQEVQSVVVTTAGTDDTGGTTLAGEVEEADNVDTTAGTDNTGGAGNHAGASHTISLTFMWIAAAMSTGSIYIFM